VPVRARGETEAEMAAISFMSPLFLAVPFDIDFLRRILLAFVGDL
jgi:hypothetical protein